MAGGISEALVTTALGLLVAVPAVWAFNYFTNKVEAFDVEMDNSSMELINYFITAARRKEVSHGAYKPKAAPVMAAPNIIPMADIMLVLLIIFMVVTPMLQKGMSVEMAKVSNPEDMPNADRDDAIIVGISRERQTSSWATKRRRSTKSPRSVRDRISNRVDKTVFIKSDGRAKYGDVVKVVDEVRSAGVDNVGLLTDKIEQQQPTPRSGASAGLDRGSAEAGHPLTRIAVQGNANAATEEE